MIKNSVDELDRAAWIGFEREIIPIGQSINGYIY